MKNKRWDGNSMSALHKSASHTITDDCPTRACLINHVIFLWYDIMMHQKLSQVLNQQWE